ncbi:hypothetical protein ACFVZD_48035 [Streptomyces sp. NPDC058287]
MFWVSVCHFFVSDVLGNVVAAAIVGASGWGIRKIRARPADSEETE